MGRRCGQAVQKAGEAWGGGLDQQDGRKVRCGSHAGFELYHSPPLTVQALDMRACLDDSATSHFLLPMHSYCTAPLSARWCLCHLSGLEPHPMATATPLSYHLTPALPLCRPRTLSSSASSLTPPLSSIRAGRRPPSACSPVSPSTTAPWTRVSLITTQHSSG